MQIFVLPSGNFAGLVGMVQLKMSNIACTTVARTLRFVRAVLARGPFTIDHLMHSCSLQGDTAAAGEQHVSET